jgi:O-antigen/teichoic acid export membrane protein
MSVQIPGLTTHCQSEEIHVLNKELSKPTKLSLATRFLGWPRVRQLSLSIADQVLSVGGMFLVNVALARTQSKEEYGIFALCYSTFTFLASLHNGAILETYTVYGSGRYQQHFLLYSRLLWRANYLWGMGLSAAITLAWLLLAATHLITAPRTILGMALASGVLLTAAFVRRTFYIRRRPDLAARFSVIFFVSCTAILWFSLRAGLLSGFSAFLITALAWSIAGVFIARELPRAAGTSFTEIEPRYWSEHWKYSRWVLITAFIFQLTTQGYFWLAAALLSVKEVGNLRAIYNIVLPIDQIFTAIALLILPKLCSRYASQGIAGLLPAWRAYGFGWFLASCGFAAVVSVLGKPVMHILYAGRFDDVAPLVTVLAFLPAVMGIGHTLNGALKAAEKPDFVFYAYVCGGAITMSAGIPLVAYLGLVGAVYGMLLSAAAYTITLAVGFLYIIFTETKSIIPNSFT